MKKLVWILCFSIASSFMLTSCTVPKKEDSLVQKEEKKVEKKKDKKNKEQDKEEKKKEEQKANKEEEKKEEAIVKKETNVETEDKPVAEPIVIKNPYDDLIAQYRNGLQTGDWTFLDQAAWCMDLYKNSTLLYAFDDINQDGIQEMLVTTTYNLSEPVKGLIQIFTIYNGEYSLVDGLPGLRSSLGLGYDGTLKTYYFHAGNPDTSISYQYLPAHGERAVEYKYYNYDRDFEHEENSVYSVIENGIETIITKEEYDQVFDEFNNQRAESSLFWHVF